MSQPLRFLIDGYNLMFQSNLVGRGRGPNWLERARSRLFNFLARQMPNSQLSATQIVFDASQRRAPSSADDEVLPSGLRVRFASQHPEADDLLEELIRTHPHPKTLTVISSDHRIRRRAKARRAKVLSSEQFLDQLDRSSFEARPNRGQTRMLEIDPKKIDPEQIDPEQIDPDAPLTPEDIDFWLREFGPD